MDFEDPPTDFGDLPLGLQDFEDPLLDFEDLVMDLVRTLLVALMDFGYMLKALRDSEYPLGSLVLR